MYAYNGIFLVSLPFLFPLECHGAYAQCLSLAFSTRPYTAGFLPIPAGLLFLSAAMARINNDKPERVFASGLFALQASVIGLGFAVTRAPDLAMLLLRGSGLTARSTPASPPFLHVLLLAATFFPLLFTSGWAVRDLLLQDTVRAVFRRGAAGFSVLALLPMALTSYSHPLPPIGGPISYFVLAGYLFGAFSPPAWRKSARWTVGVISFLVAALMGLCLIAPDFSGFSYETVNRTEVLIVFFTNLCLLGTTIAG